MHGGIEHTTIIVQRIFQGNNCSGCKMLSMKRGLDLVDSLISVHKSLNGLENVSNRISVTLKCGFSI